jgi:hypothetical protein
MTDVVSGDDAQPSDKEIADWMVARLKEKGLLYQEETAWDILAIAGFAYQGIWKAYEARKPSEALHPWLDVTTVTPRK